jgi:hypothetical protein
MAVTSVVTSRQRDSAVPGVQYFQDVNFGIGSQDPAAVAFTGGSVVGASLAGKVQALSAAGAIDLTANVVQLTGPASSTYAVTLAAPSTPGQSLVIYMVSTTGTNAVTLALTNVGGGSAATTATFTVAGHTLVLISNGSKWVVCKEFGVALT